MVQTPVVTKVTVAPDTVQTAVVVDAKLSAKPEEAVAAIAKGAVPKRLLDSAPKVMVWLPCVT
jgi:hypothetical protein